MSGQVNSLSSLHVCFLQVDRVVKNDNKDSEKASVYFTARLNYRLQDPLVVTSLLSELLPVELAIKLGHIVCQLPYPTGDTDQSRSLCWIKSGQYLPSTAQLSVFYV